MNSIYSQFLPFANSCNAKEILYNLVIKDSRARHGAYDMQTHGFEQFVLILGSDKLLQVEKHKDNTYGRSFGGVFFVFKKLMKSVSACDIIN